MFPIGVSGVSNSSPSVTGIDPGESPCEVLVGSIMQAEQGDYSPGKTVNHSTAMVASRKWSPQVSQSRDNDN